MFNVAPFLFLLLCVKNVSAARHPKEVVPATKLVSSDLRNAGNHSLLWIFLRYHKTGHDLSNQFSLPFAKTCKNRGVSPMQTHDRTLFGITSEIYNAKSIALVSGAHFHFPWVKTFSDFHMPQVRVVHFVRDPYDMVLSGFLYHSQLPVPERWLVAPNHTVCGHNKTYLMNVVVPKLAESISGHNISHIINELRHNFTLLHKKCEKLQSKYSHMSYSDMLQSARNSSVASDGIFLEAMRVTFWNIDNRGDLLRMAMNAMYEDKRMSKRVFTSQFPIGDKATFLKTTAEIFDFLMPDSDHNLGEKNKPFWDGCITKDLAVKYIEDLAFVPEANVSGPDVHLKQHITAGLVNASTRANYMSILASDREIAPILNLVRNVLLTVHN